MQIKYIIAVSAVATLLAANVSAAILPPPPPPPTLPTTKDDCKKGGWQNYNGMFKNQGDCVSFIATGGSNAPDGPNAQ